MSFLFGVYKEDGFEKDVPNEEKAKTVQWTVFRTRLAESIPTHQNKLNSNPI